MAKTIYPRMNSNRRWAILYDAEIQKDGSMGLMAQIPSGSNIALAQSRVIGNKGASGIDNTRLYMRGLICSFNIVSAL